MVEQEISIPACTTREQAITYIQSAMAHPKIGDRLTVEGYGTDSPESDFEALRSQLLSDDSVRRVQLAADWLLTRPHRQRPDFSISSYGWKHQAERDLRAGGRTGDLYITSGALICAAIGLGFSAERSGTTSTKVYLGIGTERRSRKWKQLYRDRLSEAECADREMRKARQSV